MTSMKNLINPWLPIIYLILISIPVYSQTDQFNTYQYNQKKSYAKPWFEWWYYKIIIPDTNESFYFVYGVVNPWDLEQKLKASRSYIGAGDFAQKKIYETVYSVNEFQASNETTFVQIGNNQATDKNFFGSINDSNQNRISWDINIEKKWSFNPVSWALGKNITDIEWYPAQASAVCNGIIHTNNKTIEVKNAPCYQDRNWGSIFPKWWTWIVSNYFTENKKSVLAIGGGRPSYKKTNFPFEGVSIGLNHQGKEYLFRPTDLNITKSNIKMGTWEAQGDNGRYIIKIKADAPNEAFLDLHFVTPQGDIFHDYETLNGHVNLKLYKKNLAEDKFLFELNSDYAGIEYGSHNQSIREINKLNESNY